MKDVDVSYSSLDDPRIDRLVEKDEELFYRFNPPAEGDDEIIRANFEDSYEYIRLYFDSGDWHGMRYYDLDTLIFFAEAGSVENPSARRFKVYKPLGHDPLGKLNMLIDKLRSITDQGITVTCLPAEIANNIDSGKKRQFRYLIFDCFELLELYGQRWKNVRQKITRFEKEHRNVRIEHLSERNSERVVHFISEWRRCALHERGHSYAQVGKSKFAARYYAGMVDEKNIWAYVYFVGGKVSAFQLLYRVGSNAAANPIGMSDISMDGLAEYSQVHAWQQAAEAGIRYINDGPSWRRSLEDFKRKFNPVDSQLVIECYL